MEERNRSKSGLGVLGGIEGDLRFLKTVYRMLRVGGKFVVTVFNGLRQYIRLRDEDKRFDYIHGIVHWKTLVGDGMTLLKEDERIYIPSEMIMLFTLSGFEDIKVYGCSPGNFDGQELGIEDIEMMVMGEKGS